MLKFFKITKYRISMVVILAMLLQVLMPVIPSYSFAEEGTEILEEYIEEGALPDEDEPQEEQKEPGEEREEPQETENESEVPDNREDEEVEGDEENEGKDLGDIFVDVTIKVNDAELIDGSLIEISDDTVVKLEFDWEIADEVGLKAGDWAEIKIPSLFEGLSNGTSGDLEWGNETVGTYELDSDNNLKVVFNSELEGLHERKGDVWVWLKFDEKILNEDVKQTIEFEYPINKSFTITVKPKGETYGIKKSGSPNEEINAEYINWIIDINTSLEEYDNAIVEDIIPEGLELESGSIEIYELTVGYDGEIKKEAPSNITANEFPIELGQINSAYRIKYRTNILDYSKAEYKNIAILKDGDIEKDGAEWDIGKLEMGSSIDKKGSANNNGYNSTRIIWTIDINKSELNLKNVSVEDTELSPELTIDKDSIEIYELDKQGNNWIQGRNATEDFDFDRFPINLGDLDKKAYRILFDTEIDYKEHNPSNEFANKAILKINDETRGEALAEVTVKRGTLIEKSGKETTSYEVPNITWTIYVNKANHNIKNATITDTIDDGLELRKDSIKIYDHRGQEVSLGSINGYPKVSGRDDNGFKVEFGDIDSEYKIEYITDIIDPNADLGNEAELWGDGLVGEGITNGAIKTGKLTPGNKVENSYQKSTVGNKTVDDIVYDGLNYKDKTMSWKITIDAIKEEITNLTITDTFEPEDSMVFLEDTLKVVKGSTVLVKGEDYNLTDNKAGGFVLEFEGALDRTKYEIYYKTTFNPDTVLEEGGKLNTLNSYINRAKFEGTTKDVKGNEKPINANPTAKYDIAYWIWDGGKKDGVLDRDNRKIGWAIYVNALGQDLTGTDFVITDTINDGQEFDKSTLVVSEYSLGKNGTIVKGNALTDDKYTIGWNDDENKYTLTFSNGIDKPYMIEFNTNILGISKEKYKNIANISGKGLDKSYEKEVKYPAYDSFLKKDADVDKVYTDDEINWKLTINESLSDIDAGAVLIDTISNGLVYLNDSLKIKKLDGEALILDTDYILENTLKESGDRELKITFIENITEKYIVEYTTVVVATDGQNVENNAVFKGEKVSGKTNGTKTYTVTQYSGGTGSGVRPGSIKIIKYEAGKSNEKLANVGFELYYLLNDEEQLVKNKDGNTTHYTNSKGILEFVGLKLRTYYLREVESLEGYSKFDETYILELTNDIKLIEKEIPNTRKINITGSKVWVDGPDTKPTIELQLYRDNTPQGPPVELKNGETEYTWTELDKTDKNGDEYEYTVEEVKVPDNYGMTISEDGLTITNKYKSSEIDVIGRKVWEGGPTPRPSIKLQLYRNGEKIGEPVVLEDGTISYKWSSLDKTDRNGVDYTYTVDEVEVPENYAKVAEGLTVTNIYRPPTRPSGPDPYEPYEPNPVDPIKPTDPEDSEPVEPIDLEEPGQLDPTDSEDPTIDKEDEDEEPTIDIDDNTPKGGTDVDKPTLPKTGENNNIFFYFAGIILIVLGFVFRRKLA